MVLTDKQAKALDALRHGGTLRDVADRLETPSLVVAYGAICEMIECAEPLLTLEAPERWGKPARWRLTESGRAAWAESLR